MSENITLSKLCWLTVTMANDIGAMILRGEEFTWVSHFHTIHDFMRNEIQPTQSQIEPSIRTLRRLKILVCMCNLCGLIHSLRVKLYFTYCVKKFQQEKKRKTGFKSIIAIYMWCMLISYVFHKCNSAWNKSNVTQLCYSWLSTLTALKWKHQSFSSVRAKG